MQVDRVKQAIHSGETVRVRYFGGSMPGAERLIKPIVVSGESVRAHCLQSGETKVFKLAMLEEVREGIPSELERSFVPPVQPQDTVAAFAESVKREVEILGWHSQLEGEAFTLHRRFKNGKPMKGGDVSISYEAITYDLVFDGETTVEMNHRPRERPWIVGATKHTTKTFSNAGKAQEAFTELARQLAPGQHQ